MKPAFTDMQAAIGDRLAPLSPIHWHLHDDSHRHIGHAGNRGGGHYRLLVVSATFAGQNRLQRQRQVNQALQDLLTAHIHALSIRALSPDEYAQASGPTEASGENAEKIKQQRPIEA